MSQAGPTNLGSSIVPSSLPEHCVLLGNGINPITFVPTGLANQLLLSGGPFADPAWGNLIAGTGIAITYAGSPVDVTISNTAAPIVFPITVPQGGTGDITLTLHGILLGNGLNPIVVTAEPTNGQLLIGSSGNFPVLGSLTSLGGTVTITPGPGTINLEAAVAPVATTYRAEDGTTCTPAANILNIVGTATNGINTTAAGSTMTIGMASPYSDGDFTFTSAIAGVNRTLTISNTDNTAVSSPAHLQVTVGGNTNTGDPYTNYLIQGSTTYSLGIKNSDSNRLCITDGTSPSAGTRYFFLDSTAVNPYVTFENIWLLNNRWKLVGNGIGIQSINDDNTSATSNAYLRAEVGGTSSGDPYSNWSVNSAGTYSAGIDNSVTGDPWKLTNSTTPSAGDALISTTSAGVITLFNDLDVTEGGTGVSTLTSHGILMGNGAGDIQATAEPSNGQLLIGKTGDFPQLGSLTSTGGTITITPGAGTINLETAGGGGGFTSIARQVFTSGTGNYTPTAGTQYCDVEVIGGGGGGCSSTVTANTGGTTSLGAGPLIQGSGGVGGNHTSSGDGGTGSGGDINVTGGRGGNSNALLGGGNPFGQQGNTHPYGVGGSGSSAGAGGGGGGYAKKVFPVATVTGLAYAIGGGGAGAGSGGAGSDGVLIITEYIS